MRYSKKTMKFLNIDPVFPNRVKIFDYAATKHIEVYSTGTFITTFFTGAQTPPGARPGSWASSGKTRRK